jgi:hypothetical protein
LATLLYGICSLCDGGRDDDSSSDEQPDNEISADVKDVMKVIGSVLPAKLDDKSKTKHYI